MMSDRLTQRRTHIPTRAALTLGIALVSGSVGLAYELIWTQQLATWLGHELVAVLAVLAAFFGGLALGAQTLTARVEKSKRPALWYAGCEATMAIWAVVSSALLPDVGAAIARAIGPEPSALWHWTLAFAGPFVLLLPATCAMGATLPALARMLALDSRAGFGIGKLYAANTFGAVLGVLACAFLMVPELGLRASALVCAALNAVCALLALLAPPAGEVAVIAERDEGRERAPLAVLFATGALGIGYQVLVVRILSQLTENTVYSFAILLAVYLVGCSVGGAIYQRWLAAHAETSTQRERLLMIVAGACLFGTIVLWARAHWHTTSDAEAAPTSVGAALLRESMLAVLAFLPATIAMGASFSQLSVEVKRSGSSWGRALAVNTWGASLAPLVFGVWLMPTLGPLAALLAVVAGYLLLLRREALGRARSVPWLLATGLLVLGVAMPRLSIVDVPPGGRVVRYEDGVSAAVSVIEDDSGASSLRINNRQQEGSDATVLADARQAWLPLLFHERPRSALFLGLGTGITAGAAAWDYTLDVTAVELLEEVVTASSRFQAALQSERAPRVLVADARRYVRADGPRFDVIVADLFHPARSGAGALYTREHFAAVRERLASGGVFCQWLPLHQLDLATLRAIVAAYVQVYPQAAALLATNSLDTPVLGLLASRDGTSFSAPALRQRQRAALESARLAALQLDEELSILGALTAGPRALSDFVGSATSNSDDRPLVSYAAPRATYAPEASSRERLLALLEALASTGADRLGMVQGLAPDEQRRLQAYWSARGRYLALGAKTQPGLRPDEMIATLARPLLQIVHESPDFRPAYDPLLSMAQALPAQQARGLLSELAALQPARPEASLLLQRMDQGAHSFTP